MGNIHCWSTCVHTAILECDNLCMVPPTHFHSQLGFLEFFTFAKPPNKLARSHSDFVLGESSLNSPKPVLVFWSSIHPVPCVFCLHCLKLLVIMIWVYCPCRSSYGCGVGGWVLSNFLGNFLTLQTPLVNMFCLQTHRRRRRQRLVTSTSSRRDPCHLSWSSSSSSSSYSSMP